MQATMSQLSALSGGGGATLLHEVMSFLRRCLTQVKHAFGIHVLTRFPSSSLSCCTR